MPHPLGMTNPPKKQRWWQRSRSVQPPSRVKESPVIGATLAVHGGRAIYNTTNAAAYAKEGYVENPDVRASVDILATAVGGVNWCGHREAGPDGELVEVDDAPIVRLIRRPNPRVSGTEFVKQVVTWRRIAGEAYVSAVGPKGKPPMELWLLRPDRMSIVASRNPAAPISHYLYKVNGKEVRLDADTVLHLPMFNPLNDDYGLSPLSATARLIDQAAAAADQNLGVMQNGGIPPGFLVSDGELTDVQFDELKTDLKQWGLARNAGLPELLPAGFKWQDATRSPKDMEYLEAARVHAQKQAQIMGVPAEFLSGAGEKKYSNFGEAMKALWLFAALPELDYLADELNAWLGPKFNDGVVLAYDKDDIEALKEDRSKQYADASLAFEKGLASRNEARKMIGLDAVDGGDVFVEATRPAPAFGGFGSEPGAGDPSPDGEGDIADTEGEQGAKAFNLKDRAARAEHWQAVDKRRGKVLAGVEAAAQALLDDERGRMVAAYAAGNDWEAEYKATDWAGFLRDTYRTVGKVFAEATLASLEQQAGDAPLHVKAGGWQDYVDAYVKRTSGSKVKQIEDTTRTEVKFIIDNAAAEGLSIPDIAAQIDRLYLDQIITNRSTVIARTETIAASNAGSMGAAESTGLPLVKEWISTSDDRTRSAHADMDGQTTPMDEPFNVDGEDLDFPGDSSHGASAGAVVNCRCTQAYAVAE